MVRKIEDDVSRDDRKWSQFRDLYRYIKSSVLYSDGLEGIFGDAVPFNIERLVNVLDELRKKERHTLYPFVGAWNPKLVDVAGDDFARVRDFRDSIIDVLRNQWVALPESEKADYYRGLLRFQEDFGHPLRVFSLNYDLCVEVACGPDLVQRGFLDREWDWRLFDETSDDPVPLLLYKLHGSTDWYFADDGRVTYSDSTSSISNEDIALIFGTSYKLQYVDPFLFFAYELRRWTLDTARVIVCIGYGFNDDHINGILRQALRQDQERRLLAVAGPSAERSVCDKKKHISDVLKAHPNQIYVAACGAREFLGRRLTVASLSDLFPDEVDLLPEMNPT